MPFTFNNKPKPLTQGERRAIKAEAAARPLNLRVRDDEPCESLRVTLLEAGERHCRWPYGEGEGFRYCGHRTVSILIPWCPYHLRRVWPAHADKIMALIERKAAA